MSSEYTVHSEGSSRLSIIQEQMNDETQSTCQGSSSLAFDDLRRDYKDAIQCIVHCESLIKTLEGQLTTKDDIIASLEDKIVSMSLELAKAKAASDELELSQRRMSSSLPTFTSDDLATSVEEQYDGPQRQSWTVEDDEDSSSDDDEEDFEQGLIDLNDDIGLDGVEDNCLPLRRVPDKRQRRGLGPRTLSTPIEPESPPTPPTNNGRAFSKSLPGGGCDIDDSDCWESARSQLDESTSSRGFDFGQLFGRKGSQEGGTFNNKKNRRRSSADCSANGGEDMELSDPIMSGLDESSSSRISGLGALFQRKNRRPSVVPEDNTVNKRDDNAEEDFKDIINNGGRRTMSKARQDRQYGKSNRNFSSAVCFPMDDEDVDAGLNDRSFVRKLKEMQEKDEADAALAAAAASAMPRPIKKNEVVDDNKSTAIQRTIARREAMKKQRAVASSAPSSVPPPRGMGERPGMVREKSWYKKF